MEALLLEQERLVDNLEKERQEKVELERMKLEQDKQQEQMKDTIKSLEEEIVNVRRLLILFYYWMCKLQCLRNSVSDPDKVHFD